jgi:hypothetical protein
VAYGALRFSEADLAHASEKILYAVDKVEKQLAHTAWIAREERTAPGLRTWTGHAR